MSSTSVRRSRNDIQPVAEYQGYKNRPIIKSQNYTSINLQSIVNQYDRQNLVKNLITRDYTDRVKLNLGMGPYENKNKRRNYQNQTIDQLDELIVKKIISSDDMISKLNNLNLKRPWCTIE